jgi:hypothetical protein
MLVIEAAVCFLWILIPPVGAGLMVPDERDGSDHRGSGRCDVIVLAGVAEAIRTSRVGPIAPRGQVAGPARTASGTDRR